MKQVQNCKPGTFISVEGVEGAGKSTQMLAIKAFFEERNIDVDYTREPGGTALGEALRALLLNPDFDDIHSNAELLMMFAARAQHVETRIKPALAAGRWVISDRFTDASFAYQGGGREIPQSRIQELAHWVLDGFEPKLTIMLDLSPELGLARATAHRAADRIERESMRFFERVRRVYLDRVRQCPQRFALIDATPPPAIVTASICARLQRLIDEQ